MTPVAPQTKATSRGMTVPDDFVVRVAGLPVHHAQRLDFHQTAALIEEWLDLERVLATQALEISDALFELIGKHEDQQSRGALIALRRSIFNGQSPKQLDSARVHLPEELLGHIYNFDRCRERQQWIIHHGQEVLDQEWSEKRLHLRDSARDLGFQRGLLLSSQDFHTEVLGWLSTPTSGQSRRKLELSLTQYILRASTKTSPFSTFTSLARGSWRLGSPSNDWQRSGYGELSRSVANQLMQTFSGWDTVRDTLRLALNPSLQSIEGVWRFLAWRGGEKSNTITHQEAIAKVFEAVQQQPENTYREILDSVLSHENHLAGRKLFDQLIAVGALELHYSMAERDPEHFKAFFDHVSHLPIEDLDVLPALHQLEFGLDQFNVSPELGKQEIDLALQRLCASPTLKGRGMTMPNRNTIFEDTCIPDLKYTLDPAKHHEIDLNLQRLTKLNALRDPGFQQRQAAIQFFRQRYPQEIEIDLLRFYQDFSQNQAQPTTDLTADLLEELNQMILDQHGCINPYWVDEFTQRFPQVLKTPRTVAYYAQPLVKTSQMVINAWQAGTGRAMARLRRFERKLGLNVHEQLRSPTTPDRIQVDLAGVFGTNVNLREPTTAYEIAYPGYNSDRLKSNRLELNQLKVRHCPNEQRLQLLDSQLTTELEPIHTGLLGELWLPPLFKFLVNVFSAAPIDPTTPRFRTLSTTDELKFVPRLTLGNLIVERARWSVNLATFPQQTSGESLFMYIKKLTDWRHQHGIPVQVFLQKIDLETTKPTFVNFQSALSVDLLRRQIGQYTGILVLHEVLPELGTETIQHQDGAFVHEIVLEARVKGWDV